MEQEFCRVVERHRARYPRLEPQDYGKLAYQSEFGPEHLLRDREPLLAMLREEWETAEDRREDPVEPIGNGLCRFHLTGAYDPAEAAPFLTELMFHTAAEHRGTAAGLEARLRQLEGLDVPGMAQWLSEYRAAGCPSLHHSPAFREAYHPHYRVVQRESGQFFPALLEAWKLLRRGRPALLAIDGRCGSGKTTLAACMERVFSCSVIHTDDFYLPMERRAADWQTIPGGNMDLERLEREVLRPARAGEAVRYRPFDCQTGQLGDWVEKAPALLTVVEGSYSLHPALKVAYDARIFLTLESGEQERRLRAREGKHFAAFQTVWIPMEERYFQQCRTEAGSTLSLDTSAFDREL